HTAIMDNLKFCPGDCNDGNGCTDDACDPDASGADGNGCVHTPNSASCDNGVFCDGADTCGAGSCSVHAGNPCAGGPDCNATCNETAGNCFNPATTSCMDDGNVCTNDHCDGAGACIHPDNTAPCNDNDACTVNDHCADGSCGGATLDCDDHNACTQDSC